jgi:anaerobic selenocysteine-containing dehydrogenase
MRDPNFGRSWWTRRDFLKGSAAAVAGAYGLSPGLGMAEQVPDKFDGMAFKLKRPSPAPNRVACCAWASPTVRPISISISPGPSSI